MHTQLHTGWIRRLVAGAALATAGLVLALPGIAAAGGGGASGSVQPRFVQRGDDVNFLIDCETESSSASLTGTPLGLASNIAMEQLTSREFDVDIMVPAHAAPGKHNMRMQCSDGSFTTVTIVVSPHGGAETGDGAMSTGASVVALTAGGLLIVGAGAGGVLLRRRRSQPAP